MDLNRTSNLLLIPINIKLDGKNYIVEDINSEEFYEMPEICIEAIKMLNNGDSLEVVENHLKKKYPKEEIDILDFAGQLLDLQLIAEIDGQKIEHQVKSNNQSGFLRVSPRLGKFFFNRITRSIYLLILFAIIYLFFTFPRLFPHYMDIFIFKYMFLNIIIWMAISLVLVLIHELGHVLAMRAYDLPTKLGIGHRLFLVVFETDLSLAWKLPAKSRNILYLAGICFDTVLLFLALIGQLIFSHGSHIFLGITHVIVLDIVLRIIYQCCIYMKTDLYYVFENESGCYNLMENAQQLIKKWLPFKHSESKDEVMFEEEKRTVAIYSVFYFIGVALTLLLFVIYYLPQLWFALKKTLPGFLEGPASFSFWDAVLFVLQLLGGGLLLLYAWRKNRVQE